MSRVSVALARLRNLFRRARLERELDDEVRFHLEMQIEDNLEAGMDPVEARQAALRRFGGAEAMKDRYREQRAFAIVETTVQDVRYALRVLRRSPAFTATAVTTLALAIGVNLAMFSIVNAVLLRPLPYRSPGRLVMVWTGGADRQERPDFPTVEAWRHRSRSFADLAVFDGGTMTLTGRDGATKISGVRISPNFFSLLGIQPLRGRTFSRDDFDERRRVVVISDRFWRTQLGGATSALGASLDLDGQPAQIVGILPPGSLPAFEADVWEPYTMFPDWDLRRAGRAGVWQVIGRLQPTATVDQARAEMRTISAALDRERPAAERNRGVSVVPLIRSLVGSQSRLALWMLMAASLVVLLITAANVTGLVLARSVGRAREIAVRATLGAGFARIARQFIVEGLTLAAIAGLLGVWLAAVSLRIIHVVGPVNLPRFNEVSLDPRVLGVAVVVTLLAGIVIGLMPAVALWRRDRGFSSQDRSRGATSGSTVRGMRRVLIVGEFALALVLLAGAGLLIRSWLFVERVDPGFRPDRILSLQLSTTAFEKSARRVDVYRRALEQVEALPGVERAGIIGDLFVSNDAEDAEQVLTVDADAGVTTTRVRLRRDEVSPRLFTTLGTPLLRGRFFSIDDGPDSPRVAIVNEALARRLWAGHDPIGTRFKLGIPDSPGPWLTIVGIVGDMRRQGLETDPVPQMFEPLAQSPSGFETLLVRTSGDDPVRMVGAVQAAVHRADQGVLTYGVSTLRDRLGASLALRRLQTSLLVGFSLVSLLLAAVGIYGLIHYSVAARTQEIGIRLAIGAQAIDIFRLTLSEGLRLSLMGLLIGLVGAYWAGYAGRTLLFGVTAGDPLTLAAVSLLLTIVAIAACAFPARRAMKIDPLTALRQD